MQLVVGFDGLDAHGRREQVSLHRKRSRAIIIGFALQNQEWHLERRQMPCSHRLFIRAGRAERVPQRHHGRQGRPFARGKGDDAPARGSTDRGHMLSSEVIAHAYQCRLSLLEATIRTADVALSKKQGTLPGKALTKSLLDMLVDRVRVPGQIQENAHPHGRSFQHPAHRRAIDALTMSPALSASVQGCTARTDVTSRQGTSPKWGMRQRPTCALVLRPSEGLMLDQDEDSATAIGATVPHWLLSAINGTAALILMLVI